MVLVINLKKNRKYLQKKIFFYLIVFTIIIFILIWLFQVFFLKNNYEYGKKIELINSIDSLKDQYVSNSSNISEILNQYAYNKGICSEIYFNKELSYATMPQNRSCTSFINKTTNIIDLKNDFMNNNDDNYLLKLNNPINNNKLLIYGVKLDNDTVLFSSTNITPIDSTVNILKRQLIVITVITIFIASIIAYYIANSLSKPITKLTKKAKDLSSGNFNIDFNVNSDIEEINELAETLNYTKDVLKNNDEVRRDLMANVSHDLKTPLTMIKAYAEMIRDISYNNDEKRNNDLTVITDEVDRLNYLVNDILSLSKLESNMDDINMEEFDLVGLINTIIERFKIFSITQDYEFIYYSPKKLIIKADKIKIEQVIYNLIGNAINYSGNNKKIYITILPRNNIRVNISDIGKGIRKEDINKIWDKYYKANKNHQRNTIGTGLGLSIVKNILELHSYKYGVISKKNKGTTFYFEIKNKQL